VPQEIAYLLDLLEPAALVVGTDFTDRLNDADIRSGSVKLAVVIGGDDSLSQAIKCASTTERWSDLQARGATDNDAPLQRPSPQDLFQLLLTSGTTGPPKAVMLSHETRLRSAYRVALHSRMRQDDVVLNPFPFFHINCLDSAIFPALVTGCTAVLFESFSASTFWPIVRAEGATVVSIMPTVMRAVSARPPALEDSDHRVRLLLGALRPSRQELASFLQRFAIPRYETGYGLTEAGMAVTQTMSDLDLHYPSIGLPMFDRTVDLLDEQGRSVPTGDAGEIVVRCEPPSSVMTGYWKDPDATAAALRGGWLHTGDLARVDADGFLYFVGRLKDVIKRSGENVGAEEVEAVLLEHPGIGEAAVIGVPDDFRDEAVMACIVASAGETALTLADVQDFCKTRLAAFKVPTQMVVLDDLPRGLLGKVDKKALRARFADRGSSSSSDEGTPHV
jgi:carnitine-CoA ligase